MGDRFAKSDEEYARIRRGYGAIKDSPPNELPAEATTQVRGIEIAKSFPVTVTTGTVTTGTGTRPIQRDVLYADLGTNKPGDPIAVAVATPIGDYRIVAEWMLHGIMYSTIRRSLSGRQLTEQQTNGPVRGVRIEARREAYLLHIAVVPDEAVTVSRILLESLV